MVSFTQLKTSSVNLGLMLAYCFAGLSYSHVIAA